MIFIEILEKSEPLDGATIQRMGGYRVRSCHVIVNRANRRSAKRRRSCWETTGSGPNTESPNSIFALIDLRDWGTSDGGRSHDTGGIKGSDTRGSLLLV